MNTKNDGRIGQSSINTTHSFTTTSEDTFATKITKNYVKVTIHFCSDRARVYVHV